MILPHFFVHAPWERRITKHTGFTYLLWTFVDLSIADLDDTAKHHAFIRHEERHVQQSVLITIGWLTGALAVITLDRASYWLALSALLAWPIVYWIASIIAKVRTGKGYTDNWFERDARRHAGQP